MSRRARSPFCGTVLVALVIALSSEPAGAACWKPPVAGAVVVDPFRLPDCPYCAGNRGIEYDVDAGSPVRAVSGGTVSWAGVIGGTRYVVVRHLDGRRVTYGKLRSAGVSTGDRVVSGMVIGRTSVRFYFGLRRGDVYVDPSPMLGHLVGRPRLVPLDGSRSRPAPPARLSCVADNI